MSAQLLLAGLYPPQKEQIWSTDILWQPVPIHGNPRNLDNVSDIAGILFTDMILIKLMFYLFLIS